jgi:hypothetical protein
MEDYGRELNEFRIRYDGERLRMADVCNHIRPVFIWLTVEQVEKQRSRADAAAIEARRQATKYQEDAVRAQDEAKRALVAKNAAIGPATGREMELQKDNDKLMVRVCYSASVYGGLMLAQAILRCSTCKLNLKSHVLVKCMHSTYPCSSTDPNTDLLLLQPFARGMSSFLSVLAPADKHPTDASTHVSRHGNENARRATWRLRRKTRSNCTFSKLALVHAYCICTFRFPRLFFLALVFWRFLQ